MASKKNEAYIEFKANTSEFQKGIKQMNAELKTASNALRLNSTQLKGSGESVDLLSERHDLLQQELEASTKKVELTEKSLAECKATLGENSKEYASLSNAVLNAKNQQQAIQNELDQTAEKLAKIENENKQAATSFGQLSDKIDEQENDLASLKKAYANVVLTQGKGSKEAKDLENQIDSLSSELNDNKKQLNNAEKAADEFDNTLSDLSDSAENAGDGFTVFKGALSGIIANGFSGLVSGAKNAISSVAGLSEETREYRTEMGKLEVAFDEGGFTADQATKTYKDFYAVLGDEGQSVEAVSHLAKLTNSQKELDQWTTICTGVYATFGASLPIEGLTEAANETAKVGQVTGPLADALNWAGVSEDKFNESLAKCSTEQERQQLITDTLNGLYSDAATKYKETNGAVMEANKAQSDYTDTMAAFGGKVEPVVTSVKEGFNGLLGKVLELTNGVNFEAIGTAISNAFSTISNTVLPAVVSGFDKLKTAWQWISDNKAAVITAVSGLAAGLIALNSAQIAATAASTAAKIATALQTAQQWLLNAAMSANPIGIVIIAITALVAGFMLLWKNCEGFRNFFINMWEKIKSAFTTAKDGIMSGFDSLKTKISSFKEKAGAIFKGILNFFKSNWKGLLLLIVNPFAGAFKLLWDNSTKFRTKVTTIFNSIKDKILTPLKTAKNKAVEIFQNLRTATTEKITAIRTKVTSIFNSIKEKITTPISNAKSAAINTFISLRSGISSKIESIKSKVSSVFSAIKTKMTQPVEAARDKIKGVVDKIKGFFSNMKLSLPKIKVPKISISGKFSLNPPSVPKFSISWNAKGALFTKPTVFQGFGEAGKEYALPLNERSLTPLATLLNKLMYSGENGLADALASRFDRAIDRLTDKLEKLESRIYLDGKEVGRGTASYADVESGARARLTERGLAVK